MVHLAACEEKKNLPSQEYLSTYFRNEQIEPIVSLTNQQTNYKIDRSSFSRDILSFLKFTIIKSKRFWPILAYVTIAEFYN